MKSSKMLSVAVSAPVMTALEMDVLDRHETLSERVDDIADWYNRITQMKGDYHLGEVTTNTMMKCVQDLIVIARYYRKASMCEEAK